MALFGGIEAGGTKFVCAIGTGPGDLRVRTSFPTTTPAETIAQAIAFFKQQPEKVAAIGIGAFGPVDPNPASPTYGYITSTPKLVWQNTDIRGAIMRALDVPVGFDTDVNGAAIGEHRWGASQDVESSLYITVGTGIGGGVLVGGKPLHGALHPEVGHILVRRDPLEDPFPGNCPFHGDCLEGLAAGPAVGARWKVPAQTLPADHPAWPLEARYLALGLVSMIYVLSPERIILGGGIMQQPHLFPMIRTQVQQILNGYLQYPAVQEGIDGYIVPPGLGSDSGVLGSIALAEAAYQAEYTPNG